MRRIALLLATGLIGAALGMSLFVTPHASADDISADSSRYGQGWQRCTKKLNGKTTTIGAEQRTVIVVNQTARTKARTGFYVRINGTACRFKRLFLAKKTRLGYGGTVEGREREQGTGTTPLGTYTITKAFGLKSDPGSRVPYHRVRSGDYWVMDNESKYYNTLRNKSAGGFRYWLPASNRNGSERLRDYPGQYDHVLVINFNRYKIRNRGAGIFLHIKGEGATAGCVAISRKNMKKVLAHLRSGDKIVIKR